MRFLVLDIEFLNIQMPVSVHVMRDQGPHALLALSQMRTGWKAAACACPSLARMESHQAAWQVLVPARPQALYRANVAAYHRVDPTGVAAGARPRTGYAYGPRCGSCLRTVFAAQLAPDACFLVYNKTLK